MAIYGDHKIPIAGMCLGATRSNVTKSPTPMGIAGRGQQPGALDLSLGGWLQRRKECCCRTSLVYFPVLGNVKQRISIRTIQFVKQHSVLKYCNMNVFYALLCGVISSRCSVQHFQVVVQSKCMLQRGRSRDFGNR